MVCGSEIDCEDSFSLQVIIGTCLSMSFLGLLASYLLYIHYFGGLSYLTKIAQIIFYKHYRKIKIQQAYTISIGKTIQKNAPIKIAEIYDWDSEGEEE